MYAIRSYYGPDVGSKGGCGKEEKRAYSESQARKGLFTVSGEKVVKKVEPTYVV